MQTRYTVMTIAGAVAMAGGTIAVPETSLDPRLALTFTAEPAPRSLFKSPFDGVTLRAHEAPSAPKAAPDLRLALTPVTPVNERRPETFVPSPPLELPLMPAEQFIPFGEYRYRVGEVGFSLTLPTGRDADSTGYRDRIDGTPQQAGFGISVNLGRCEPR